MLVAGALIYLTSRAGGERILSLALTNVREAIRGDLQAERLEFSGNRLVLHRVKLLDPEGELVAEIETIDVRLSLLSLVRRTLDVRKLTIAAPRLELRSDDRGLNLSRAIQPRHPSAPQPEQESAPGELGFLLRDFELAGGAIHFEQVSQQEKRALELDGLEIRGSAGYASPSQSLRVDLKLDGQLREPSQGPFSAKISGKGSGDRRAAQVALTLAGLRLDGEVEMVKDDLRAKLARLEISPQLIAAWVPAYPLLVPISASGEAAKHESLAAAKLELKAGGASVLVEGSLDISTLQSPGITLRARSVNLRELIAHGPESALELALRAQGGGLSLKALEGNLELIAPAGQMRGQSVGPVEIEARAQRGVVEIRKLVANLPGLRLAGAGRASERDLSISGTLTAANLDQLSRTLGGLARQPPLNVSGSGELQFALTGPTKHPGVSLNGAFAKFRYDTYAVENVSVAGTIPDIHKPLQSQLLLTAARVVAENRTFRNLSVKLTSRGRDLQADLRSAGFAELALHAGGVVDADHQGLLLNAFQLHYPEAQWTLQRPARIRFAGGNLSAEPVELRSGKQAILAAGWLRKKQLSAELKVQRLDLDLLPKPLIDPALHLAGLLSADVRAEGRLPRPAVKAQVNLQNGRFKEYDGLQLRVDASYERDRAVGTADARGLGTGLRADFDVPIDALRLRKRVPVHIAASLDDTAIDQVLTALGRPPNVTGTAAAKIELGGMADDPKLHFAFQARSLRYEQSPPTDLTLIAQSADGGKLASSLEWTLAGSKSSLVLRTPLTLSSLLQSPPTPASLRSLPVELDIDVHELPLEMLRDLGLAEQDVHGTLALRGEVRGSARAPSGKVVLSLMRVALAGAPPIDASLVANASPTGIDASINAQRGNRRLLDLTASVQVPPGKVQGVESVVDRPLSVKASIGPVSISELRALVPASAPTTDMPPIPPPSNRPADSRSVFDGVLRADLAITGSLANPSVDVRGELDQLSAEKAALGKAKLEYAYRGASSNLSLQVASTGGTLSLEGQTKLDLSYRAISKGLEVAGAPINVALNASRFDLASIAGITSAVTAIGGTLDASATVQGTIGAPHLSGKLEWNKGILALLGFGEYQQIHLLVEGTDQDVHLRELLVHGGRGQAKITADARRAGRNLTLTGNLSLDKFPLISDNQLVATLSLNSKLEGELSPELVDIRRLQIREAHVDLPTAKRKNLQSLTLPDDIVLLRHGKPIDQKGHKKATAVAGLGGSGDGEDSTPPASKQQIVINVDGPRNIWIKGSDLNIEIGLGDGFRVEIAQSPLIFGEVKLLRGRADVLGRRFDVQKNSTVRFSGPPETPTLDVTALYNDEREQVKVFVTVHGMGKSMSITTSSEPPLTDTEIYTLIATGHRTLRTNSGASTSGSQLAVSALGSLAATQLKNVLAAKLPLDVLSIETGGEGGLTGTKLEAGTYVTDRMYIGYTARLNARPELGQNANEVRLDYQISPHWFLEATYGDAKAGGADLMWNRDY